MALYFKYTNEDIILTEEIVDQNRNNNIFGFCETNIEFDEVRDHCHLTGKSRGPAQNNCNTKVTQKYSNFIPFVSSSSSNYDRHLCFKKLVDKKKDKVKFDKLPTTDDE